MNLSLRPALGSLAAMAALSLAPAAKAQVTLSTLSHVTVTADNTLDFDIDGDGNMDFWVNNVFATPTLRPIDGSNNTIYSVFADGIGQTIQPFAYGETIFTNGGTSAQLGFDLFTDSSGYVGVNFERSGQTFAGWVLFDLTAGSGGDVVIDSAGWQATYGADITAGAPTPVPEPATTAAAFGLLAGLAAWLRRRKAR